MEKTLKSAFTPMKVSLFYTDISGRIRTICAQVRASCIAQAAASFRDWTELNKSHNGFTPDWGHMFSWFPSVWKLFQCLREMLLWKILDLRQLIFYSNNMLTSSERNWPQVEICAWFAWPATHCTLCKVLIVQCTVYFIFCDHTPTEQCTLYSVHCALCWLYL